MPTTNEMQRLIDDLETELGDVTPRARELLNELRDNLEAMAVQDGRHAAEEG
jgi:ElaB/YqjD/DUF883 family membrane-anchored ribosome-binding protein